MSDSVNDGGEFSDDCWCNTWEKQTAEEIENAEHSHVQILDTERSATQQKLWDVFQTAAQCVAVLYKGTSDHPATVWGSFQTAAGNLTCLYKESVEGLRRHTDRAIQTGHHKRNKELLHFLRKKKHFHRDEVMAFLAGKNLPSKGAYIRGSPRTRISLERMPQFSQQVHHTENDLTTFHEALGMHAMQSNGFSQRRRNSGHPPELQATFVGNEILRHKRNAPSPPHDVTMDSPQHKRCKYS